MKKLVSLILVIVLAAAPLVVAEMSAEEIVAKHVEAIGGEKAFKELKSLAMNGNMFAMGMPLDFKSYLVMPDKAYMEASTNNMKVMSGGTNGTDAWQSSAMMGAVILEGEEKESALEQTEISKLVGYKDKGYKISYIGEDMVKGAKAHKISLVQPDNDTTTYYIDAESFYILREKSGDNVITFSKHQMVDDKIVRPFKVNITGASAQGQVMITFESMELNVTVPDSLFVMPADAIPMSEMQKKMQGGGKPGGGGK